MTEGERWTRRVLATLRDRRYRPRAWVAFTAESFRRSSQNAASSGRARRESLAAGVCGTVAWAGVAASGDVTLGALGAGWWIAVVAMLWWHLGMIERADGTPIAGLGPANAISLTRLAPVPALLVIDAGVLALALIALTALDVVDGRLARARDECTRLGFWLDGAADTFVLAVAAVAAGRLGVLPWWIAALVLVRVTLPWVVVSAVYFATAAAPPTDRYLSGRIPGTLLVAGLVLALAGSAVGVPLAALGAVAGVGVFLVGVARSTSAATAGRSG